MVFFIFAQRIVKPLSGFTLLSVFNDLFLVGRVGKVFGKFGDTCHYQLCVSVNAWMREKCYITGGLNSRFKTMKIYLQPNNDVGRLYIYLEIY